MLVSITIYALIALYLVMYVAYIPYISETSSLFKNITILLACTLYFLLLEIIYIVHFSEINLYDRIFATFYILFYTIGFLIMCSNYNMIKFRGFVYQMVNKNHFYTFINKTYFYTFILFVLIVMIFQYSENNINQFDEENKKTEWNSLIQVIFALFVAFTVTFIVKFYLNKINMDRRKKETEDILEDINNKFIEFVNGLKDANHDSVTDPISYGVFNDPVVSPFGHSYDRENINKMTILRYGWRKPTVKDPMTNTIIEKEKYIQNNNLKRLLNDNDKNAIICPISKLAMEAPVIDENGISYDEKYIIALHENRIKSDVDVTLNENFRPNRNLKDILDEWRKSGQRKLQQTQQQRKRQQRQQTQRKQRQRKQRQQQQ